MNIALFFAGSSGICMNSNGPSAIGLIFLAEPLTIIFCVNNYIKFSYEKLEIDSTGYFCYYKKMKKIAPVFIFITFSFTSFLFSQEALKSTEEEYYDFLSLQGIVERPTLGYRTLSDSEWHFALDEEGNSLEDSGGNIWKENNLGKKRTLWESDSENDNWFTRGIDRSIKFKIYGPEWFNSYNTAAPYGQNDGALWQGKGYNTSLTAGARLEAYGFEVTLKPQVSFSQNKEFDLMDNSAYYTNKYAYIWGYGNNIGADAPQRFGDSSFWNFDWSDTEIRYSWRTFTIGFGTQSPWIGPAWLNPVLHSNNAGTYPKFDVGLRKTSVHLPFYGWYIGDIEGRIWMGYLTESDYFDNDSSNDHNRINGFNFSYAPSFIPGLSLGLTKVCLSKWNSFELKYLNPFYSDNGGIGENIGEDQKMSAYADFILPKGGIEIYSEIGLDDYLQGGWFTGLSRYPFDTLIWTLGIKKSTTFSEEKKLYGEIIFEFSDMDQGRNKVSAKQRYACNMHHQLTQGYTNKGQYIGTSLANGGNAQTLTFKLYYPRGNANVILQRCNPDDTYSYMNLSNENQTYKGYVSVGLSNNYFIIPNLIITTGIEYQRIYNSLYYINENSKVLGTQVLHNLSIILGLSYNF